MGPFVEPTWIQLYQGWVLGGGTLPSEWFWHWARKCDRYADTTICLACSQMIRIFLGNAPTKWAGFEIVPDNPYKQAQFVSLGHYLAFRPIKNDRPCRTATTHACAIGPLTHVRDDDLATGRLVGARSLISIKQMGDSGRVPSSESTDYKSGEGFPLLPSALMALPLGEDHG